MHLDRRSFLAIGAAALVPLVAAQAHGADAVLPPLDAMAGALPDKSIGSAGETLYVYLSLGCPSCANFHATTLPELRRTLVEAGRLRIVYREFPLDVRAFAAAMIVRRAGDRYFDALDLLFAEQTSWVSARDPGSIFRRLATQVGVDKEAYDATMADRPLYEGLSAIKEQARHLGVRGTPTLFIRGRKVEGDLPAQSIAAAYASGTAAQPGADAASHDGIRPQ
jgi:protein-disulfide isomerase